MVDEELVQVSCLCPRSWVVEIDLRADIEQLKRSDIVRRAVGLELRRPRAEAVVIHRPVPVAEVLPPVPLRPRRTRHSADRPVTAEPVS